MEAFARLDLRHPWRTATFITASVAMLELVVLLVLLVALLAQPASGRSESGTGHAADVVRTSKPPPAGPPKLTRKQTKVLVLNGNGQTGVAGSAADLLRRRGYLISGVGNASRSDHTTSVVMYRGGFRAEALRLARDTHVRTVGPLDGLHSSDLAGAQVAVIIGG